MLSGGRAFLNQPLALNDDTLVIARHFEVRGHLSHMHPQTGHFGSQCQQTSLALKVA